MKQITIATYNICHGHYAAYDWSKIAAVIREADADLVGFQEIDMFTDRTGGLDTVTELIRATGLPHALFVPAMNFDGGQYGTAILSRFPIQAAEIHPLPSAHYEPRAFGCVTLTLGDGTPFTFLNTHLSYESREQQKIQIAYISDWMKHHVHAGTFAALTGDFNTEDFSMFTPITAMGYATVNRAEEVFKTFRTTPLAIDNILYSEDGMIPVQCGMIDANTSDHNLLWCRFRIQ